MSSAGRFPLMLGLGLLGLGAVGLFVWKKGGIAGAAASVGAGAVEAVGGAVSGGVGAIGSAVGLPTPAQTTTDAEEARWIIDNVGTFAASKWAGAPAFIQALMMPEGSGKPPSPNSEAGRALLGQASGPGRQAPIASYDETERLARLYPAPYTAGPESIFSGGGSFGQFGGLDGGTFDGTPFTFSYNDK